MPLSSERVENKPLSGPEVKELCCHLLHKALDQEWAFNPGTAHPRIGIEITAKFHFVSASMPKITAKVKPVEPIETAPLKNVPEGSDEGALALKLEKTVDNPNLERVHAGLPITVVNKTGALPGQMFPRIDIHKVTYDPNDYPAAEPPKITDISAETAAEWDVKLPEVPSTAGEIQEAVEDAEIVDVAPVRTAMGLRKKRQPRVVRVEDGDD